MKDPVVCELYVISSQRLFDLASSARDRVTQAVMLANESSAPLECEDVADVLDDDELKSLISTLGVGIDLSRFWQDRHPETFELEKLRYHKIILLADDGPKGARVREQLLTWLFLYFRPVLESGYIYTFEERPSDEISQADFEEQFMAPEGRSLRRIAVADTLSRARD